MTFDLDWSLMGPFKVTNVKFTYIALTVRGKTYSLPQDTYTWLPSPRPHPTTCCTCQCVNTVGSMFMSFGMECLLTWPYQLAKVREGANLRCYTAPLLLSINNWREVLRQNAFPYISKTISCTKFEMAGIDPSLKVAYSKVSSAFG